MNPANRDCKPLHLNNRLLTYAAMAGAAALCSAKSSAEVVYTPVDQQIASSFYLDLNHDGINDFYISSYDFSGVGEVNVFPQVAGNRIAATAQLCGPNNAGNAAALPPGKVIGPGVPFLAQANCMVFDESERIDGPWQSSKNRYLGFVFVIDGKEHFGWARIRMNIFSYNNTAALEGFAYETIPNKPIVAGDKGQAEKASADSGTLGALAAGSCRFNSQPQHDGSERARR